jgi:hypothetical protein
VCNVAVMYVNATSATLIILFSNRLERNISSFAIRRHSIEKISAFSEIVSVSTIRNCHTSLYPVVVTQQWTEKSDQPHVPVSLFPGEDLTITTG